MPAPLYAQQPRTLVWRRRVAALGTFGATVAAVVVVTTSTLGGSTGSSGVSLDTLRGNPVSVAGAGHLTRPVQQAAGAPGGAAGAMVGVGGVDDRGAAVSSIQRLEGTSSTVDERLPSGLAGAGAVGIRGAVYVFGGGGGGGGGGAAAGSGTDGSGVGGTGVSSSILGVASAGGGSARAVGRLPQPVTDAAVASVGGTAFVIGGFDGTRELDGVVAWTPGGAAHRTAHLPVALRFAAAASVDGTVIIAGGMTGGVPSRNILRFDPARHRVTRIGQLPVPLAHAGAGTLGGLVFVIGGRAHGPGSETRAIYAVDPATGDVRFAGTLPVGIGDMAVATVADRILIAGGINRAGVVQSPVLDLLLPPSA
jgi:hypothetical protein